MKALTEATTKDLVQELTKRGAVETIIVGPYADVKVGVNGPATILIVRD